MHDVLGSQHTYRVSTTQEKMSGAVAVHIRIYLEAAMKPCPYEHTKRPFRP